MTTKIADFERAWVALMATVPGAGRARLVEIDPGFPLEEDAIGVKATVRSALPHRSGIGMWTGTFTKEVVAEPHFVEMALDLLKRDVVYQCPYVRGVWA